MTGLINRYWTPILSQRLKEPRPLIQIILGPRQSGKSKSLAQLEAVWDSAHVVSRSADDTQIDGKLWIEHAWGEARRLYDEAPAGSVLLLLDEIQKIDQWSETIKKLWDEAFLIVGLKKFEGGRARLRSSSPKLQVHNNALMSALLRRTFAAIRTEPDVWGHYVESAVGAHLVNQSRVEGFDLGYLRDGNFEVDFVITFGKKVLGVEVKNGRRGKVSGLAVFSQKFPKAKTMIIDRDNLESFFLNTQILSYVE